MLYILRFVPFLFFALSVTPPLAEEAPALQMAITIDDLPVQSLAWESRGDYITTHILDVLKKHDVISVGFVNEGKLYKDGGELQQNRVGWLRQWAAAGQELGNHTFSHNSINRVSLPEYRQDIIQGEKVTKELYDGKPLRYFRHPFLHKGNEKAKKEGLENVLDSLGYTEAPVTIDNSEWIYAQAYRVALKKEDSAMSERIRDEYIQYMMEKTAYSRRQAGRLFDRDIAYILLIHANMLNADYLDELLIAFKREGFTFTTLEKALNDPAYASSDDYVGSAGCSWIDRWALTRGHKGEFFAGEPRVPAHILEYSEIESE